MKLGAQVKSTNAIEPRSGPQRSPGSTRGLPNNPLHCRPGEDRFRAGHLVQDAVFQCDNDIRHTDDHVGSIVLFRHRRSILQRGHSNREGRILRVAGSAQKARGGRHGAQPARPCHHGEGPNIEGDLKFREWLEATILPTQSPGTTGQLPILTDASLQAQPAVAGAAEAKGTAQPAGAATTALTKEAPKPPPFDIISHEVNFVVVAGGNITPTWTLVTFSANTGNSPLIGATRTRTNNVLITMGRTVNDEA